mmetsp:Transcript_47559/g.113208  ORF Transcript_47559/g.113208 Transcript_47559/m.113208 type:complete len:209 (-) Transcript_47559:2757-3383(-)
MGMVVTNPGRQSHWLRSVAWTSEVACAGHARHAESSGSDLNVASGHTSQASLSGKKPEPQLIATPDTVEAGEPDATRIGARSFAKVPAANKVTMLVARTLGAVILILWRMLGPAVSVDDSVLTNTGSIPAAAAYASRYVCSRSSKMALDVSIVDNAVTSATSLVHTELPAADIVEVGHGLHEADEAGYISEYVFAGHLRHAPLPITSL